MKKTIVTRFFVLFLAAAFLAACEADISGASSGSGNPDDQTGGTTPETGGFAPLTLGLTPGNDTTEMRFNWYSAGNPTDKVAKIKLIDDETEEETIIDGKVIATLTGRTAHKVEVTELSPGSSYTYSVSNNGTVWSEEYSFSPPPPGDFRFVALSDSQIDDTNKRVDGYSRYPALSTYNAVAWKETMEKVVAANPSFIASMGDQVNNNIDSRNEAEYTLFFAPPGLRSLPYAPTAGNHDQHTNFYYHFNTPNEQFARDDGVVEQLLMGNYYYLYNNVLFVVLNTGTVTMNSRTMAQQYVARYKQVLTAAKEAHDGKYDWLIVQHHRSTASVANHVADVDIQLCVEGGFETLMSEQEVDFVLAGHDHVYARSYPLLGKDDGLVSLPDKTSGENVTTNNAVYNGKPGNPIYLTFDTASGVKYYQVSADKTFPYNTNDVTSNNSYPYLGASEDGSATMVGLTSYKQGNLPVSNAFYSQPWMPSYCIVDVTSDSISFKTYTTGTRTGRTNGATVDYSFNAEVPFDSLTVNK